MYLFADELLALDDIRSELDGAVELEAICGLVNGFLGSTPLPACRAELCDGALRHALVHAPTRLRAEIAERLAHVEDGAPRTIRSLAQDRAAAVAVPVLRYSPLLLARDLVALAKRYAGDPGLDSHVAAIAGRRSLPPEVTTLLAGSGTPDVMRVLAANPAARWW